MPYILLQSIIFPFKESETGGELQQLHPPVNGVNLKIHVRRRKSVEQTLV